MLVITDKNATSNVLAGRLENIRGSNGSVNIPYVWICGDPDKDCTASIAANATKTNTWRLFSYGIAIAW